MATKLVF